MPQMSPMPWTAIILSMIMIMTFSKSLINWNIKTKQMKEKNNKKSLTIKWKF